MLPVLPVFAPIQIAPSASYQEIRIFALTNAVPEITLPRIPDVPFYSQFNDITAAKWKKVGCGVVSLAMVIEYYKPDTVSVDRLLGQAISSGAYQPDAGWTHKGLVLLSRKYGLDGTTYDLSALSQAAAFSKFKDIVRNGPVIVSVHYKFDPKNPIPHLVVIDGVDGDTVYYNDPASTAGGKQISTEQFLKAWKKRFIVVRPTEVTVGAVT